MKTLKDNIMESDEQLRDNLCAYADYLENNNCEFFILAFDKDKDKTTALMSKNSVEMLSAVFDKSIDVYDAFKTAEMNTNRVKSVCMN